MTIGSYDWNPENFDYDEYFKDSERFHEWAPPQCSVCSRYGDDVQRVVGLEFRCVDCITRLLPRYGYEEHTR